MCCNWIKHLYFQMSSMFFFQHFSCCLLNPISQGAGVSDTPLGNQGRSCFRSHVAKSYFETYKSYDHMQNFRPLSQKFSEISRFEKFEFLRFCLTLGHRNCHNSLNFWDTGLIFWIYSSFYVFYKLCLET